jgi:hypothetical protein
MGRAESERLGREETMRIRRMALIAVAPALLSLAACGSSSKDPGVANANSSKASSGPSASSQPSLSPQDAQLKYAQCMRQNGVNVPDPQPGGNIQLPGNIPQSAVQAANQKCLTYLQQGGQVQNPNSPQVLDQEIKFAQCMRKHGVNMPDPQAGQGGMMQLPNGIPPQQLQAAQQACSQFLQGPGLPVGGGH